MDRQNVLRIIGACACVIFISSIVTPFLQARFRGMGIPEAPIRLEILWSFKENVEYPYFYGRGPWKLELWFADYWSRGWYYQLNWVGPFLIFMFEAQIFTVLFAALTIFKVKPYLFFLSTMLNVFTIFCMWFVNHTIRINYETIFQVGFWLTFPSTALFFAAFLQSWKWQRKESTLKYS